VTVVLSPFYVSFSQDAACKGGAEEGDTWVLVDLQLPSLGIRENERLSARLLSCLPTSAHVRLSTGYCNPAEHVITGLRRFAAQGQVSRGFLYMDV
jgi:hypothetical protein